MITEKQKSLLSGKTADELRAIASRNFSNKVLLEYIEMLMTRKDPSQCIIIPIYELTDDVESS